MKKIPTLFKREFKDHKVVNVLQEVTEGFEWVLAGGGVPTIKFDGSCCAIINGELYKRYDAKKGRKAPDGAIPCCDPDPVTGHHPHWVKVTDKPEDKWFIEAYRTSYPDNFLSPIDGTYEAVGPHFQGNPYNLEIDMIRRHGSSIAWDLEDRRFEGIKKWLRIHDEVEGVVFWKDGEPQCKIKRSDFGFEWPVRRNK